MYKRQCLYIADGNLTGAAAAHYASTRIWMRMGAGGNRAGGEHGLACVDCQMPRKALGCRAHFALVGRQLAQLRMEANRPPEDVREALRQKISAHVQTKFDEMCCARFPDGTEKCGKAYCVAHFKRQLGKRAARASRRLREAKHPYAEKLEVNAHVGADLLDPSLHLSLIHISEPTRLGMISYAVFCLKKKNK